MSTAFARRECLTECPCESPVLKRRPTATSNRISASAVLVRPGFVAPQSKNFAPALPIAAGLLVRIFRGGVTTGPDLFPGALGTRAPLFCPSVACAWADPPMTVVATISKDTIRMALSAVVLARAITP
jgi:hypothetical protein